MSLPGNGIFVVQGEMAMLVTAMRRSTRWGSHSFLNEEYDVLMRTFQDLKAILNQVDDLKTLDPLTFLSPFLEVIRSKETTGPVTSLALSAIHKFLSYGLIDPTHPSVPATVEDIAEAVTHARFVGTDHASDGVVLMKILQVLRTLMLSPEGAMLSDESVCEIMLSCFRICFETRLTELLRRNAEQCLRDMTQLIFMRLPQFPPDDASTVFSSIGLSLKKKEGGKGAKKKGFVSPQGTGSLERKSPVIQSDDNTGLNKHTSQDKNLLNEAEITIEPIEHPAKPQVKKHGRHSSMDLAANANIAIVQIMEKCVSGTEIGSTDNVDLEKPVEQEVQSEEQTLEQPEVQSTEELTSPDTDGAKITKPLTEESDEKLEEYVNGRGIRFTQQSETVNLQPYGLVCVREVFRFLISLCNPLDAQNTSGMVHLGLCLLQTALEVSGDHLANYPSLLELVKDPLCRNLVSLLSTERISIFALDLQVSYLIFESLRSHLKYQMEAFFKKILEILSIDTTKAIYELKEIHHLSLEFLAQMFRIPGFCNEVYLNYDCDVYCIDLFENLTNLLSQNVVSSTAYNIHSLSLEALMTIIEAIEASVSHSKIEASESKQNLDQPTQEDIPEPTPTTYGRGGHISLELGGLDDVSVVSDHVTHDISQYTGGWKMGRHKACQERPSDEELRNTKVMKKYLTRGIELFNSHPEKGIEYLQKHGYLHIPLDPKQVVVLLKECPHLDKKMIGEYICKRSSRGEDDDGLSVLGAFAESFDFASLRIDQALRMYLETFRLPGEAPLIFLVMERFAERWHSTNGEPFANTDAAFRLAYAVIMLNMDQHNHNAKKLNVPMTVEDFVKNLRGCNGNGDFEQSMLEAVFHSIKSEEMVMPAERVGPVRDAYLWRELVRRPAKYLHDNSLNANLYALAAAPTVTALSSAFERAPAPTNEEIESNSRDSVALFALRGLERCAILTAMTPATLATDGETDRRNDALSVDALILTLCKFTGLTAQTNYIAIGVTLGQSTKCQLSLLSACALSARLGDHVRGAWRHLAEIAKILYVGRLLPKSLIEAEDYSAPNKMVSLVRDPARGSEAGLLSSIYSYIALGETGLRAPTPHERGLMEVAAQTVAKCNLPGLLIAETKFLQIESLQELVRAIIAAGTPPDPENLQMNPQLEDVTIFFLELLSRVLIQNRDRTLIVWAESSAHFRSVVLWAAQLATRDGGNATRDYAVVRSITTLLRTAARLMRSETCAQTVLDTLTVLFELPYRLFYQLADTVAHGVHDIVKTSAQNVHVAAAWRTLLALAAASGAGAWPTSATGGSSRSEASSDDERRPTSASGMSDTELTQSPRAQGWILVKSETSNSQSVLDIEPEDVILRAHKPTALVRCCETLALVVRDVAHVTPDNAPLVVTTLRLFVAATLYDGKKAKTVREKRTRRRGYNDSSDEDETGDQCQQVNIQLLDLMHTLHSRAAQIFKWWKDESDQGEEYDLWELAWMPLLQGIALYCTDRRKQVSNSAIAYLQRALLAPGLACMCGARWDSAFNRVLLPLVETLATVPSSACRANTIMCKVFLHHLTALSSRPTFDSLWLRVVAVEATLVNTGHESVTEAATESLKNALLVMHSVKIFSNGDGYTDLWYITWEKINEFLPNLKNELFPDVEPKPAIPSHIQPTLPPSVPTLVPPTNPSINPSNIPQNSPPVNQLATNNQSQQTSIQQLQSNNLLTQNPNLLTQNPHLVTQNPNLLTQNPNLLSQNPNLLTQNPNLATQNPITLPPNANVAFSGTVPIRNTLLSQGGLTSSVLLQPLNEMISTPIGMPMQMQSPMPILYPTTEKQQPPPPPTQNEPYTPPIESFLQPNIQPNIALNVEQSELYSEYLSNPYNVQDLAQNSTYEPKQSADQSNQSIPPVNQFINQSEPIEHKSFSEHSSPMHTVNKNQFGSTDNLKKDDNVYNFSSYFSGGSHYVHPASDVFDNLMSTREG